MKKLLIILATIIVFFLCLLVGFQFGDWVLPAEVTPTFKSPVVTGKQQNIFLIHVDSIENTRPKLISVWILFLYYSDYPSMMFKPLYMSDGRVRHPAPLAQMLLIQPDGSIPTSFIDTLHNNLNIRTDGYVLLDDDAVRFFARRFPGPGPTPEPYQVTIPTDEQLAENICAYLGSQAARKGVDLEWNEVLPDHFRTEMNFTAFMANWIRLTTASNPPNCKIIPNS